MHVDASELKKTTLASVSEDRAFFVGRGDRITNIYDLANCIESLTQDEFAHHVSVEGHKNDFAQWIFDVLKNPSLSRDLNYPVNLQDKKHFVKTIRDHVAWLETV
jgi:hypothetical protein